MSCYLKCLFMSFAHWYIGYLSFFKVICTSFLCILDKSFVDFICGRCVPLVLTCIFTLYFLHNVFCRPAFPFVFNAVNVPIFCVFLSWENVYHLKVIFCYTYISGLFFSQYFIMKYSKHAKKLKGFYCKNLCTHCQLLTVSTFLYLL